MARLARARTAAGQGDQLPYRPGRDSRTARSRMPLASGSRPRGRRSRPSRCRCGGTPPAARPRPPAARSRCRPGPRARGVRPRRGRRAAARPPGRARPGRREQLGQLQPVAQPGPGTEPLVHGGRVLQVPAGQLGTAAGRGQEAEVVGDGPDEQHRAAGHRGAILVGRQRVVPAGAGRFLPAAALSSARMIALRSHIQSRTSSGSTSSGPRA